MERGLPLCLLELGATPLRKPLKMSPAKLWVPPCLLARWALEVLEAQGAMEALSSRALEAMEVPATSMVLAAQGAKEVLVT